MNAAPPAAAPPRKLSFHLCLLVLLSLGVGFLCLDEPGFGDELTYWSLAFDLHDSGPAAWHANSFHDLRWPVWGPIWLWQTVFGPGLASYYFLPLLTLSALAVVAFLFGKTVTRSVAGGWASALALLFAPVIDVVTSRPMPDLAEAALGGCALLCWWAMMHTESRRRIALFGIASGLAIGVAFSNRATGLFISPVLAIGTLCFFRNHWRRLLIPAATAAMFFAAEGAVYYAICGDWLHSLHANLGGTHAKDVFPTPAWKLPFRYLPALLGAHRIRTLYLVLTLFGAFTAWRRHSTAGRLIILWFGVIYLEYSCAIQSLHPVLPLVGTTVRYLAAFALPMSILAALGAMELWRLASQWPRFSNHTAIQFLVRRPALVILCAAVILAAGSKRPWPTLGFSPEMTHYMKALPAGTSVFTHGPMRDLAFLVDPADARRLSWQAPHDILTWSQNTERTAKNCQEFWYLRKRLWLPDRQAIERGRKGTTQQKLASYFNSPQADWKLAATMTRANEPELFFFHRRHPHAKPAFIFNLQSPELAGLVPQVPAEWRPHDSKTISRVWHIPPALRGRMVGLVAECSASSSEAASVKLSFTSGRHEVSVVELHPIFHQATGKDFSAFRIPRDADRCSIFLRVKDGTHDLAINALTVYCEGTE